MKIWWILPLAGILTYCIGADRLQGQPEWYTMLPDCPCRNPDEKGVHLNDGWAIDKGEIAVYHPGAEICFRSYPFVKTAAGKSGQQCCYDAGGDLIRSGISAGTPDKVSTCAGEDSKGVMKLRVAGIAGHFFEDVRPWKKAGTPENAWKSYNTLWIPNQGQGCR